MPSSLWMMLIFSGLQSRESRACRARRPGHPGAVGSRAAPIGTDKSQDMLIQSLRVAHVGREEFEEAYPRSLASRGGERRYIGKLSA